MMTITPPGYLLITLILISLVVLILLVVGNHQKSKEQERYDPLRYLDYAIGVLSENGYPKVNCIKAVARLKRHRKKLLKLNEERNDRS